MSRTIATILSIDVEPDGFQLSQGRAATTGYDATVEFLNGLRGRLADATGRPASFGWFFRMDPQIEAFYGRADHLVSGYGNRVAQLLEAGDHVGLHTHAVRWDGGSGAWIHDITDRSWLADAHETGFAAFEDAFGVACTRHRGGAGIYDQFLVDTVERLGAKVDSALEPRTSVPVGFLVNTGVDASPMASPSPCCIKAPRQAYRPSAGAFLEPGGDGSMVLIPASTSRLRHPLWRTAGSMVKNRQLPSVQMLYPDHFSDPAAFWDLVALELRLMRRPYVNIALRTDAPGSRQFNTSTAVFAALAKHPLARRLEIVDSLAAAERLVGEPALQ